MRGEDHAVLREQLPGAEIVDLAAEEDVGRCEDDEPAVAYAEAPVLAYDLVVHTVAALGHVSDAPPGKPLGHLAPERYALGALVLFESVEQSHGGYAAV